MTDWQLQGEVAYGVTTIGGGEGVPQGFSNRTAMMVSLGMVRGVLSDTVFYGLQLSYFDRGIRRDIFPNNDWIVLHDQGPSSDYVGVIGFWGWRLGRVVLDNGFGLEYMVASDQFDTNINAFRDAPRLAITSHWGIGYEYRIAPKLVMFNKAIMNFQMSRPNFFYMAFSVGFRIVDKDTWQGRRP